MAKDKSGKPLKVGDRVYIPCTIKHVHGDGDLAGVDVEFDDGKGAVHCNSDQVQNFDGNPVPPPPPPGGGAGGGQG